LSCWLLKDLLYKYYQRENMCNYNYKLNRKQLDDFWINQIPEDFILFGLQDIHNHSKKWDFAITSDVASDKQIAKVSIMSSKSKVFTQIEAFVDKLLKLYDI